MRLPLLLSAGHVNAQGRCGGYVCDYTNKLCRRSVGDGIAPAYVVLVVPAILGSRDEVTALQCQPAGKGLANPGERVRLEITLRQGVADQRTRAMKLLRNVAGGDALNVQQKDSNDGRVLVITLTHVAQPLKEQREHSRSDQAAVERRGY